MKTIEEYKDELKKLNNHDDPELNHCQADDILCEILKMLGHEDVVNLYEEIEKWFS